MSRVLSSVTSGSRYRGTRELLINDENAPQFKRKPSCYVCEVAHRYVKEYNPVRPPSLILPLSLPLSQRTPGQWSINRAFQPSLTSSLLATHIPHPINLILWRPKPITEGKAALWRLAGRPEPPPHATLQPTLHPIDRY